MSSVALCIGTYARAGGSGLQLLTYDTDAGFRIEAADRAITNASFGLWSSRYQLHYLVDEQPMGSVSAYTLDGWNEVARTSSDGREPCYLALDGAQTRLAAANYGSGSVALFDLASDGALLARAVWTNNGHGPNPDRQEQSHMHCVRFSADGSWLYAVDLGADQILRFDLRTGDLAESRVIYRAPAGSGPRHLLLHPNGYSAVLVSELASMLTLLKLVGDEMVPLATCSTLPDDYRGQSLGGHLALNRAGDRAYVTNRGHDSVAVVALDAHRHALQPLQHFPSGGSSPRHILLAEKLRRAFVAHEKDGYVTAFALAHDGCLTATGHSIQVNGAAFVFEERP